MKQIIKENIDSLKTLCIKYRVESFYLFGSAASGSFGASSDIDFLVKFKNDIPLLDYSDTYFDLLHSLEKLFKRKIDLVPYTSLKNPYLISEIEKTKQRIYEA